MSPEHEAAAEIADALLSLKAEFAGEPSIAESLGVIAAETIIVSATLKLILAELQAANAMQGGK